MSRSVIEWKGDNDDQSIPPRVKVRVWLKFNGCCAVCTRPIKGNIKPAYDHIIALCNGGEHSESNLQLLCAVPCHQAKSAGDVALKSTVARKRAKHLGIGTAKRSFQSAGFQKSSPQRTASRPIQRKNETADMTDEQIRAARLNFIG